MAIYQDQSTPPRQPTSHTAPLSLYSKRQHKHASCNSCHFLWPSSKRAATGYDPWHVPKRSWRGWRDKLWRNSKPSLSAAGHPVSTQRTSYLSHFQVVLCGHSQAGVWNTPLKSNINSNSFFLNSIFAAQKKRLTLQLVSRLPNGF